MTQRKLESKWIIMDAEKAREYVSDVTVSGDFGSNCCGAKMYEMGDNHMCTDCKEWCEPAKDEEAQGEFSPAQKDYITRMENSEVIEGETADDITAADNPGRPQSPHSN